MSGVGSTDSLRWKLFVREIENIGREIKAESGGPGFKQFRKMECWGRLATVLGYLSAWTIPNPLSAFLISLGNFARWSLVLHPVSHGAFDQVDAVPGQYKSHNFARGWRRWVDWFDWITPGNWSDEHNVLHHYHLGSEKDPDVVWRNSSFIRESRFPVAFRWLFALLMATIWKPVYYATNTLAESRFQRKLLPTNRIGWNNWSPFTAEGRELWFVCLLPYAFFRFVFMPALFLPLGTWAAGNVLLNSLIAEIFANWHSFAVIAPNHTGDDVWTFSEFSKGKAEFYLRQIVGSVNYPAGSDWQDFLYGGMNYQIEHHLWPDATLLQCQKNRLRLKDICRRYGVPYHESPLLPRVLKTLGMMAGTQKELVSARATQVVPSPWAITPAETQLLEFHGELA